MRVQQRKAQHVVICEVDSRAEASALAKLVESLCLSISIQHHYNVPVSLHPSEWRSTDILRQACAPGTVYHITDIADILEKHKYKRSSAPSLCAMLAKHGILLRATTGPQRVIRRGYYKFPVKMDETDPQSHADGPPPQAPSA